MSGFLYFRPSTQTVTKELADEIGLGYAFSSMPTGTACAINTPSGQNGYVFADEKRLGEYTVSMDLDNQEWRKIPKSDCYVGYWKAAPPVPEDLLRTPSLPGYVVKMGDHQWIVPLTARFDDSRKMLVTALPCYLECDKDGNWNEGGVLELHRHLWEIGQPFRDDVAAQLMQGVPPRDFTNNELAGAAIGYLQANYVVGPMEMSMMRGLQQGPEIHGSIMAANDFATFARWSAEQKKSHPPMTTDGLNTSSGAAA